MSTTAEPQPRRLYMDNAATSFPKPRAVIEAMTAYATELGASAGRGAYQEAVETGRLIAECRRRLNRLFHGEKPEHFVFTLNCSDALNLAIKGLIDPRREGPRDLHAHRPQLDPPPAATRWRSTGGSSRPACRWTATTGLVDPDDDPPGHPARTRG